MLLDLYAAITFLVCGFLFTLFIVAFAELKLLKIFPFSGYNDVPLDFLLKALNISFHTEVFNLSKMVLCLV